MNNLSPLRPNNTVSIVPPNAPKLGFTQYYDKENNKWIFIPKEN